MCLYSTYYYYYYYLCRSIFHLELRWKQQFSLFFDIFTGILIAFLRLKPQLILWVTINCLHIVFTVYLLPYTLPKRRYIKHRIALNRHLTSCKSRTWHFIKPIFRTKILRSLLYMAPFCTQFFSLTIRCWIFPEKFCASAKKFAFYTKTLRYHQH